MLKTLLTTTAALVMSTGVAMASIGKPNVDTTGLTNEEIQFHQRLIMTTHMTSDLQYLVFH